MLADPYPFYARIREQSPCFRVEKYDFWMVTRYDDVVAVSRNHAVFSSTGGVGLEWKQQPMMPMHDPPDHTRLRRLVSSHFTPKGVSSLERGIERTIDACLERMFDMHHADLVTDFAEPLSLSVIADLMGVPDADRTNLRKWADNIMGDLSSGLDPDAARRAEESRKEFVGYLKALVNERRAHPRAGATDVITRLVAANQTEVLTHFEVTAFCVLLLVAGFEPTVNAVANTALAFLEHPDESRRVMKNPAMCPAAIEEAIRYDGAVQAFFRNTLVETAVGGVKLPAGAKVMINFGAANRDPHRYGDPDAFRVDRNPEDHVGFGVGVHFCLGAALARLQMNAIGRVTLRRVRALRRCGDIQRASTLLFRGIRHLPIEIESA